MSELITVFNQENLQVITRNQYFRIEDRIRTNSFLDITRNARFGGDRKGNYLQDGSRVLLVNHYDGRKTDGSLSSTYKVDKELWGQFEKKFPQDL